MKTKTAIVNDSVDMTTTLKAGGVGLLSFVLGGAQIFGAISPFGIALVAALPLRHAFTAAIGSAIGTFLFLKSGFMFYQIAAIFLAFGIKLCLSKLTKRKLKPVFLSVIAFVCAGAMTFMYCTVGSVPLVDTVMYGIEVLLVACFTYFFAIGASALLRKRLNPVLSYVQLTSIGILFIAFICSLTRFSMFNVNFGVTAGVLAIYVFMCRYGVVGASVVSIIVSIALNLYSAEMLEFAGILIIASFVAGIFSPLKKFGQLSGFLSVSTFCMLLLGAPVALTYHLIAIFIATIFFVLIPERLMMLIDTKTPTAPRAISTKLMQKNVSAKIKYASETIKDLQYELKTITDRFNEIDYNNIHSICDATANSVCKGCSKALDCWENHYTETMDAFYPIISHLKTNGSMEQKNMPVYFKEKCCKPEKLIQSLNEFYQAFLSRQTAKRQTGESRQIVFEQFHALSNLLYEVGEEIGDISGYDETIARTVAAAYEKLEDEPLQVVCSIDGMGRTTVDIFTDNVIRTSSETLCAAISSAANKIFDLPSVTTVGGKTRLSFFEKANFTVDFSVQQSCSGDNSISGDSYEYFTDTKGYAYLLLSDGMGSGKRAAIDSVMTCSIMSKLLKSGFGIDSAIKLISSALLVKSTDESFSTIDMAKIDLYTGKVELLKAGAAPSFADIGGDVKKIDSEALPIGIIQPAECDRKLLTMRDGDILVILSDGVTSSDEEWIPEEIKRSSHKSAKEISVRLCYEAKKRTEEHDDDITVIVAKLNHGV